VVERRTDLTFKYNLKRGRHGWLRLTPAYSVKIVRQILEEHPEAAHVLDPFSGTGTTGLICAEQGIRCDLIDINPFLVWLANAKTTNYEHTSLRLAKEGAQSIGQSVEEGEQPDELWIPPIHDITRWWPEDRLGLLAKIYHELSQQFFASSPEKDLLLIAFCHLVISWSNAAFNHQSMSFKEDKSKQLSLFSETQQMLHHFSETVRRVVASAERPIEKCVRVIQSDSRHIPRSTEGLYDCVVTSPPYPNRMSYIRELRPYMYWLGYLKEAREAGELDWQAIGGTWGIATSRLQKWQPNGKVQYPAFEKIIADIAAQSLPLANYVHKYFVDITAHIKSLFDVLTPGAKVFYVVGNSKFYDTLVPVELIYAYLLEASGFVDPEVKLIRKRNSKKDLFEFIVSAKKP
jgi:DNA modification methylase